MEKFIKTTMIGSIDAIEKKFKEQIINDPDFKIKFAELREEILNLGNRQIRLYKRGKDEERNG